MAHNPPDRLTARKLPLQAVDEFHLAVTESQHDTLEHILFEDPRTDNEWERGVICVITRSSGRDRVSFLVHDILEPGDGDITYGGSVQFAADYRHKAVTKAREVGDEAGLLYVHTHPNLTGDELAFPTPSNGDLETAEQDLFEDANRLGDDAPLAIGIVKDTSRRWRVIGYEFDTPDTADDVGEAAYSPASARLVEADCVRVVGEAFHKCATTHETAGVAGVAGTVDPAAQDSTIELWGEDGQQRLNALRVGLVGAGGGGSILAEHLPRMGVGELVIVDYDRLEPANLNRAQGATTADADARRPKVTVAERLARLGATAPGFSVDVYESSVVEHRAQYGAVDRLLDCDIIIHAAEGEWPTRVLDEIAHAHLIPVISGGSHLHNEGGVLDENAYAQTTIAGAGQPCQHCARHWRETGANSEMHNPDATGPGDYGLDERAADDVSDDEHREPSTNSVNLIVTGMVALRLQDYVLGVCGEQHGLRRFQPRHWSVTKGIDSCKPDCPMKSLLANGDTYQLTLSSDPSYAKLRRDLSGGGD